MSKEEIGPQVFLPGDDCSGWDLNRPAWLVPEAATSPAEAPSWADWGDGGHLTEEEVLPQVLTGRERRLAFAAADRIAAGEPA